MTFNPGDKVIYGACGVAEVTGIEHHEVGGTRQAFYALRVIENGARVLIPLARAEKVGLRPVVNAEEVQQLYKVLSSGVEASEEKWHWRYQDHGARLSSGTIFEVAGVLRDLYALKVGKALSMTERKMLSKAQGRVITELAVATDRDVVDVEADFRRIFN